MAMTNLGAAIGRLRFGKAFKALPSSIVVLIAVARLIVMPIIGILTVRGLVSGGVLDKENKMLQFVLMVSEFGGEHLFLCVWDYIPRIILFC